MVRFPDDLALWTTSPREALHIWEEIYQRRCYAALGISVPAGGIVLDVGANIGALPSLIMASLAPPWPLASLGLSCLLMASLAPSINP